MISDMINKKKLNPVVTEMFIRGRKLDISIVFITQIMANVALYWSDSSLMWKDSLNALSYITSA